MINRLLSVEDVARLFSISVYTVRAYSTNGKLHPVRIGRRVLFEETELQRFIDQARASVGPEKE
jgi:excisionase family DNA binding protein